MLLVRRRAFDCRREELLRRIRRGSLCWLCALVIRDCTVSALVLLAQCLQARLRRRDAPDRELGAAAAVLWQRPRRSRIAAARSFAGHSAGPVEADQAIGLDFVGEATDPSDNDQSAPWRTTRL